MYGELDNIFRNILGSRRSLDSLEARYIKKEKQLTADQKKRKRLNKISANSRRKNRR